MLYKECFCLTIRGTLKQACKGYKGVYLHAQGYEGFRIRNIILLGSTTKKTLLRCPTKRVPGVSVLAALGIWLLEVQGYEPISSMYAYSNIYIYNIYIHYVYIYMLYTNMDRLGKCMNTLYKQYLHWVLKSADVTYIWLFGSQVPKP